MDFFIQIGPEITEKLILGEDLSVTQGGTYATEVDCPSNKMSDSEYRQLMQSLNRKQSELCTHLTVYGNTN